jgi:hypothetical protein
MHLLIEVLSILLAGSGGAATIQPVGALQAPQDLSQYSSYCQNRGVLQEIRPKTLFSYSLRHLEPSIWGVEDWER